MTPRSALTTCLPTTPDPRLKAQPALGLQPPTVPTPASTGPSTLAMLRLVRVATQRDSPDGKATLATLPWARAATRRDSPNGRATLATLLWAPAATPWALQDGQAPRLV